jgi:hypothetical protein
MRRIKKTNIFSLIFLIMMVIVACEKNDAFMGAGVLTGYDPRDCACCGGLLINLNSGSSELFTDSTYQVDIVPDNLNIDANSDFPIYIDLDYSKDTKKCGKTIDILRFKRK